MSSPNFELSELRYFHSVAVAGSFAEGARRVHVSGPAVSKAVKKLEESLGSVLFDRSARRVALTPSGQVLREHVRELLDALDRMQSAVDAAGDTVRGELRVGSTEEFSAHALPVAIVRLAAAHPQLVVRTFVMGPQEVTRRLADGELDVGLVTSPAAGTGQITAVPLVHSPCSLVCGVAHPLANVTDVDAETIGAHGFVVPQFFDQAAPTDRYPGPRRVTATVEQMQMAIQMVVEGGFLGYFPDVMIRCQLNHGELRRLMTWQDGEGVDLAALHREGAAKQPAIEALLAELRVSLREALNRECAV